MNWRLYLTIGIVFGGGLFWLLLRQVDIAEVGRIVQALNLEQVGLAIAAYWCALLLRAVRWQTLLNTVGSAPYRKVLVVLLAGYAVNNIIPARLGEVFRASLARTFLGIGGTAAFATIAVERTFDGILFILMLLLGLLALPVKAGHRDVILAALAGGALLFGSAVLVLVVFSRVRVGATNRYLKMAADRFDGFQKGLLAMRGRVLLPIILQSLLVAVADASAIWLLLSAVGILLTPLQLGLVIGITALSMLLPTAPGFVGTLQFAYVIALTTFGYAKVQGLAVASAAQIFLLLPQTAIGVVLMIVNHIGMAATLRKQID